MTIFSRHRHILATLPVLALAMAVTSCADDGAEPPVEEGGVPIRLTTTVATVTEGSFGGTAHNSRAGWIGEFTDNADNALTQFRCFAFYGNERFMDNALVSRNPANGVCTWSENTHYWPKDDPLHFYAFAPYDYRTGDTQNTLTGQTSEFNLTVENNRVLLRDFEANNPPLSDVIYAMARDQRATTSGGSVNLDFRHALSCIEIYMINYHPYLDVDFHGADFLSLKYKADFIFPENGSTSASNQGHWTNYNPLVKKFNTSWLGSGDSEVINGSTIFFAKAPHRTDFSSEPAPVKVLADDHALFLLPQTLKRWTTADKCNTDEFNSGQQYDTSLPENAGYKPCLILMGRVRDSRTGVSIVDDYKDIGNWLVVPLNPNADGSDFTWQPGKKYRYYVTFGGNGNNMGWTVDGHPVFNNIEVGVIVEDWEYKDIIIYQ